MKFILPDNAEDAERLRRIGNRLLATPMGRAYIKSLHDAEVGDVGLSFDRQNLGDAVGVCYRNSKGATIALNPDCDDIELVSALAHEICHVPQPRKPLDRLSYDTKQISIACTRLMEGDAFVHQFIFAIDCGDAELERANFDLICKPMPPEQRAAFAELATRWAGAQSIEERHSVMADIFWSVQATRLGIYDRQTIEYIEGMQKGDTLHAGERPALDIVSEFTAQLGFLPSRIGGGHYNNYLGDDPVDIAKTMLRAGMQAELRYSNISVIDQSDTLKYSKPAQGDSLKFGK